MTRQAQPVAAVIANGPQREQTAEDRYYIVMHHMAQVLWWQGAAAQALAALTNLVTDQPDQR